VLGSGRRLGLHYTSIFTGVEMVSANPVTRGGVGGGEGQTYPILKFVVGP